MHQVKKYDTLSFLSRIDTRRVFKLCFPSRRNGNIYLYIVTFSSCHYFFSTAWMICWIIRIALFCMVIIVRYMCSIIRIFLITVMVVLLYVCLYHVYFLYFNIHRLYIIFLSIYQVKCGFHPTRKHVGFSPQIYNFSYYTVR